MTFHMMELSRQVPIKQLQRKSHVILAKKSKAQARIEASKQRTEVIPSSRESVCSLGGVLSGHLMFLVQVPAPLFYCELMDQGCDSNAGEDGPGFDRTSFIIWNTWRLSRIFPSCLGFMGRNLSF